MLQIADGIMVDAPETGVEIAESITWVDDFLKQA
jgi:hypothetical protein